MTSGQELLLVALVVYLWECLLLLPEGTVAFGCPGGGAAKAGHVLPCLAELGRAARRVVLADPRPWWTAVVSQGSPLAIAPTGVAAVGARPLPPAARAFPEVTTWAWPELPRMAARDTAVEIGGRIAAATPSEAAASAIVRRLAALSAAADGHREPAIRDSLAQELDAARVRARLALLADRGRWVRRLATAASGYLFIMVPVACSLLSLERLWRPLLGCHFLLVAVLLVAFHRAHYAIAPTAVAERWQHLLTFALLPPAAPRAYALLGASLLPATHPAAVAAVVLAGGGTYVAAVRRDLAHPLADTGAVERWQLAAQLPLVELLAADAGCELTAPPPTDPEARRRCPRCLAEYGERGVASATCDSCPGVTLEPVDGSAAGKANRRKNRR